MPINVDLQPPPQFDRSLIGYATINFNRLRDALRSALGGDYQTGQFTKPFVGFAIGQYNIAFPRAFTPLGGPIVILTNVTTGATTFLSDVIYSTNGFFSVESRTVGGGLAANDLTLQWVAFYP